MWKNDTSTAMVVLRTPRFLIEMLRPATNVVFYRVVKRPPAPPSEEEGGLPRFSKKACFVRTSISDVSHHQSMSRRSHAGSTCPTGFRQIEQYSPPSPPTGSGAFAFHCLP